MFAPFIENIFRSISANTVTELFIWLILALFITAVFSATVERRAGFVSHAPTLMTSLGILGTFVGIVIGLLHFNTNNIDGSIPELLEGLKTAFITSVAGLLSAILFNFVNTIFLSRLRERKRAALPVSQDVEPKDIYASLEAQRDTLQKLQQGISGAEEGSLVGQIKMLRTDLASTPNQYQALQSIDQGIQKLNTTMTGAEEGSLLGQLKLMRAEQSDNIRAVGESITSFSERHFEQSHVFEQKLFEALKDFSEMMSKAATEQIIEALKDVIVEFNQALTEQFGENFKALDESVKKLVVWQEQYKQQVEVMSAQYEQSVNSLVDTRQAVAGIWQECENIPRAMNDLKDVLEVNQHQIAELQNHLQAFVSMRDAAVEAVPTIQQQVEQVGQHLMDSSTKVHDQLQTVSADLLAGSNEMRVALSEGAEHFRDSVTQTQQSFAELGNSIKDTSEQLGTTLQDSASDFNQNVSTTLGTMSTAQVAMHEQVEKTVLSLESLGVAVSDDMQKISREFESTTQAMMQSMHDNAGVLTQGLTTVLEQSQHTFQEQLRGVAESTGQTMNSQLEQLEKATAQEISRVMNTMGESLVQITDKFVQDYTIMVNAMDRVVNAANQH